MPLPGRRARAIAELIGPDMIKLDPGLTGTVETQMIKSGVPAITLELNPPESFDPVVIGRAVAGIQRVMADLKMLPEGVAPPNQSPPPFVGDTLATVRTTRGGFTTLLVDLGDAVVKGQIVARVADPFGRTIASAALRFRRAPPSSDIGDGADDALTISADHPVGPVSAADPISAISRCHTRNSGS